VSPEKKSSPKMRTKRKKADPDIDTLDQDPPSTPKRSSADLLQEDSRETPLAISSAGILMPPAFTPSIEKTLNKELANSPLALPDGLTKSGLKSRLDGKKIKYVPNHFSTSRPFIIFRGAFLTPQEMEQLTESWKPYRSLGNYRLFQSLTMSHIFWRCIFHVVSCESLNEKVENNSSTLSYVLACEVKLLTSD
jgi:hypothetical protein